MRPDRSWSGLVFNWVGSIEPEREPDGSVSRFMPQARYSKRDLYPLNRHGAGPFCRFRVPAAPARTGAYILTSDDEVRYVGIAENLARRWGLSGYGSIQPKNCYAGGQSTNCKINAAVLRDASAGRQLDLYFVENADRHALERQLILALHPPWNG